MEEVLGSGREEANLGVGVQAIEVGALGRELLVDEVVVGLILGIGGGGKAWSIQ